VRPETRQRRIRQKGASFLPCRLPHAELPCQIARGVGSRIPSPSLCRRVRAPVAVRPLPQVREGAFTRTMPAINPHLGAYGAFPSATVLIPSGISECPDMDGAATGVEPQRFAAGAK
jgi:hypothetical protein